jgi:hypothetical protein
MLAGRMRRHFSEDATVANDINLWEIRGDGRWDCYGGRGFALGECHGLTVLVYRLPLIASVRLEMRTAIRMRRKPIHLRRGLAR